MSDLRDRFDAAAADVKKLPERPDNEALLKLYAFYKQATIGDVEGSRPGLLDFAGGAKFDAWAKLKGTSKEKAMQSYIDCVEQLKREA
jgi:diazepam-binding inhibitor (GABA receptor modulating acyl-CoA-binding protein)